MLPLCETTAIAPFSGYIRASVQKKTVVRRHQAIAVGSYERHPASVSCFNDLAFQHQAVLTGLPQPRSDDQAAGDTFACRLLYDCRDRRGRHRDHGEVGDLGQEADVRIHLASEDLGLSRIHRIHGTLEVAAQEIRKNDVTPLGPIL
jgi:hypothetical protein